MQAAQHYVAVYCSDATGGRDVLAFEINFSIPSRGMFSS